MTNLFSLNPAEYLYFILMLFRVAGILLTAPVTGSGVIPAIIKINIALIFTLLLFNTFPTYSVGAFNADSWAFIIAAAKETLLGIFIGMIPRILFAAIELAGTIISFTIGFSTAIMFDPSADNNSQIFSVLKNALMILIFLALNAHYVILEAIKYSFEVIPVSDLYVSGNLYSRFMVYMDDLFFIGLKLSYPIIAVILLTNLSFGLLTKSIPQLNVFVVGMPLTILIGLFFLALGLPVTVSALQSLLFQNLEFMISLITNWYN